jgi:hypothetical protein
MRILRNAAAALALALLGTLAQAATPPTPEEVVRAYADAATRHDVEALLALYAPDVHKFRFPGAATSEGREYNRERYKKNFAENPGLTVKIVDLMSLGDKVVCRDVVTGLASGKTSEELTVYQVTEGQISNIVYVERLLH